MHWIYKGIDPFMPVNSTLLQHMIALRLVRFDVREQRYVVA